MRVTSHIEAEMEKIRAEMNARFNEKKAVTTALTEKIDLVLVTLARHQPEPQQDATGDNFVSMAEDTAKPSAYLTPLTIVYDDNE